KVASSRTFWASTVRFFLVSRAILAAPRCPCTSPRSIRSRRERRGAPTRTIDPGGATAGRCAMDGYDARALTGKVGRSPWGAGEPIGRLKLITEASRRAVMERADPGRVYDLAVTYKIGMASWLAWNDPAYQNWMTHTPPGTVVDNASHQTPEMN